MLDIESLASFLYAISSETFITVNVQPSAEEEGPHKGINVTITELQTHEWVGGLLFSEKKEQQEPGK